MAAYTGAKAVLGLVALQLIFTTVIPAVTSTVLNPGGGDCYLNLLKGSVCDFVYITAGMGFLFSLLLGAGTYATHRQGPNAFVQPIFASLSLFAAFWWMVLAITITIRGGQATDAGYDYTTERNAVIGLSWLVAVLFFFSFLVVVWDRVRYRAYRTQLDRSRSVLDAEEHAQFKTQYAATQALGSVPLS